MRRIAILIALSLALGPVFALAVRAQEVLPFPRTPSGSTAGRTMQESVYSPRPRQSHLPKNTPNILIVLMDDTLR